MSPSGRTGEDTAPREEREDEPTRSPRVAPRFSLLGAPELLGETRTSFAPERRFQLLALLATRAGEWVLRDELAGLLWPERANVTARRNLRYVIFKAREVPGVEDFEATDHALRWSVRTDLHDFEAALLDKRLADAIALRRGELLDGIDDPANPAFAEWLAAERARFDARWQQAAHNVLAAPEQPQQRAELAQRLLQSDPLDEAAMGVLLESELSRGQAARARQLYRDYAHRLADELGVEPSRRLRNLLDRAPGATIPGAAAVTTPLQDARFVGRKSELAQLVLMLQRPEIRLITIVGPGGVGKSSLARRALCGAAATFPGGTAWIDLQDLGDTVEVLVRLSQRLGLRLDGAHDPAEQIGQQIGRRRVLCVLDNAERLDGLAVLLMSLMRAAPSLCLLLTSRVRLPVQHESLLPLAGLAVPDEDSRDFDAASAFDAVRLFQARAATAQPGFDLSRHLEAVVEIVDAVAGLPLAIELAAAWVRLLPPSEIARELRGSLELLERDPTAPSASARPEHCSLRAVFERSWQLLAPAEREAMSALAVFQGGFTRSAALAVAQAALPLLSSLVDKSFLRVQEDGRFDMHPLIAADATARLDRDPTRARACRTRHAEYFASLLSEIVRRARADHEPVVECIERELANSRAAWYHAIANGMIGLVRQSVEGWRVFFELRGQVALGVAHFRSALEAGLAEQWPLDVMARLRAVLSRLLYRQGDFETSLTIAQFGIESAERSGERRALSSCLSNAGSCHCAQGHWSLAGPLFERALTIGREDGVGVEIAAALSNLGIVAKKAGLYDDALACYSKAIELERELGHHAAVVRCLNNIGGLHMERNEWAQARRIMEQGLRDCERHHLDSMTPYLAFGLGAAQLELGEVGPAEKHLRRSLERSGAVGISVVAILAEANLGRIAARRGDRAEAVARFRSCARDAQERSWTSMLLQLALFFGECLEGAGRRVDAARVWQMVIAHPMSEAGLRDSATRWLAALAPSTDEQMAAQRTAVTLDDVIDSLFADGETAAPTTLALPPLVDPADKR